MLRRRGFLSGLRMLDLELAMVLKTARPGLNRMGLVKKMLRKRLRKRLDVGSRASGDCDCIGLIISALRAAA